MEQNLITRPSQSKDEDGIWEIIKEVISSGDTYVFSPNSSKEKMLTYWFADHIHTYTVIRSDQIVGTFIIKDNHPDLGSHIANASYMISPKHQGMGLGRQMAENSLIIAKELGYRAMQFNIVVKSNERALKLWDKMGFKVVGEVPEAFKHPKKGYANALILWKKL